MTSWTPSSVALDATCLSPFSRSANLYLSLWGFHFPRAVSKRNEHTSPPFWLFPELPLKSYSTCRKFLFLSVFSPATHSRGKMRFQRYKSWAVTKTHRWWQGWALLPTLVPLHCYSAPTVHGFLGGSIGWLTSVVTLPSLRLEFINSPHAFFQMKEQPKDMVLVICLTKCCRFIRPVTAKYLNQVLKK